MRVKGFRVSLRLNIRFFFSFCGSYFVFVVVQSLSCVQLFATSWAIACQAPLSMGFPRQEYWSGLLFPSPRYLPNPGMEPISPALTDGFFTTEPPGKRSYFRSLYQVSEVVITNYHKVGGLDHQRFVLSQFQRPETKIKCLQALKALGRIHSLLLPTSNGSRPSFITPLSASMVMLPLYLLYVSIL